MTAGGCGIPPPSRTIACRAAVAPKIVISPADQMAHTQIRVLTYNVEGLSWPARSGRAPFLQKIGAELSRMRESANGPDIVLFQEMFSTEAKRAVEASGYPVIVSGPKRTSDPKGSTGAKLPGKASILKGEVGARVFGSGLAIASRWPAIHVQRRPFGHRSCAGYDCLSNKGILLARLWVPGLPEPLDIYDTHLNARRASGVSAERNLAAHERQAEEASQFIDATHDDDNPLVFGGDFNMRRSDKRWENWRSFTRFQHLDLVHRVCSHAASGCDVRVSWDGDTPWMDTQDLQFYWKGTPVAIRPVRVEAVFDGSPNSPKLSDHDGFLVTYDLSWPAQARPAAPPPAC